MSLQTVAKNAMLVPIGSNVTHLQIGQFVGSFTSKDTKTVSWGSASAGKINISSNVVFTIEPFTTVNQIRLFAGNPSSGGVLWGIVDVTAEAFENAGTYTLTSLEIALT
jgi:hypothetical protein